MLYLLTGDDRLVLSERIMTEICVRAKEGTEGQILVVPEQFSHEAERQLCAYGGDSISRYAEVLSLSRLADRVAAVHGGAARAYLDKGGRVLAMALAAEQVSSRIKFYGAVLKKPEFLTEVLAVIDEFQSYGLLPDQLLKAASAAQGRFAVKLEELGLLYEAYLAICANGRADPAGKLLWLRDALQESDWAADKSFYFDGFMDFTGSELRVLEALLQQSRQIWIALPDGCGASPVQDTVKNLRRLAQKWEIPVRNVPAVGSSPRTPDIAALLKGMFGSGTQPVSHSDRILLRTFPSVEEECRQAVVQMKRWLQSGSRCRQIAVACTDMGRYEAPLRAALRTADLPFYMAGREDILSKPILNAVLSALQAAVGGMDYEEVALYLKSGLPLLAQDRCDRLDCYAYMWNLRGGQWERPWELHPAGFGEKWRPEDQALLEELNADREAALEPLFRLRRGLQTAKNTGEMVVCVYDFLELLRLQERLEEQANVLGGQLGQELVQLHDVLVQSLEQTWLILGDTVRAPEDFVRLYRVVLTQYRVGTIPAGLDQIYVGTLQDLRQKRVEHLLVLGAEDGCFPSYQSAEGLLTEEERKKLQQQGLSLSPLRADRMDHLMSRIHGALSAATGSIWLSYAGDQPAWLFRRAAAIYPDSLQSGDSNVFLDVSALAAWRLRTGDTSAVDLPQLERWESSLRALRSYDFRTLSRDTVSGLYGRQIYLSASRIDKYAACRFAFFLAYGLKAEPRRQAKLDPSAFGTFVHEVLQHTVQRVMAEGGFSVVTEERLLEVAMEEINAYAEANFPRQAERAAYLLRRSQREILDIVLDLGDELRNSQFAPVSCELEFSAQGPLHPVQVEGKIASCSVSGFVDRVDLYEKDGRAYVRVVDYKTGKKDFDYTDILNGAGLQMLIYLFALKRHGAGFYEKAGLIPAGVLYLPARKEYTLLDPQPNDETVDTFHREERRRKGLISSDPMLLAAMEKDPDYPRFMPYGIGKNGASGDLADALQMDLLERHVLRTLASMTDGIASGDVMPNPIVRGQDSSCRFCDYKTVCHMDLCSRNTRIMSATGAEKFWQKLAEQEEKQHG